MASPPIPAFFPPCAPPQPSSVRSGFLHVKGKSGLKHTRQLLECWAGHREFPTLHVVGRFTWDEVEAVANAPNVRIYPKVCLTALVAQGRRQQGWPGWVQASYS